MTDIEFSNDELEMGVEYCKRKRVHGRILYDILRTYDIPASWYREGKVPCLDELRLFKDDDDFLSNEDFKWDLEELIHTGSCYGLSVYIFQLLEYIQP